MRQPHDRALAGLGLGLGIASVALEVTSLPLAYRIIRALGGEIDWGGMVWELFPLALMVVGVLVASDFMGIFSDESAAVAG